MTAWKPDQSESDLRAPAKPLFPSFIAVYLRFRAIFAPFTCLSAPPSPCLSALLRRSIVQTADLPQTPQQIPFRFPHIQHERSIFDNEWHAQHRFLNPPFTILGRHRAPSCHPERSERSERSRGISLLRSGSCDGGDFSTPGPSAPPVEMTTPPCHSRKFENPFISGKLGIFPL